MVLLGAVGVGAREVQLLVPERGQVEAAPGTRHPDEGDLAAGPRQAQGVLYRARRADAIEHLLRPPEDDRLAELRFQCLGAEFPWKRRVGLPRVDDLVGAEAEGFGALAFVLGHADYAAGVRQVAEGGHGEEADVAGPDYERRVVRPGVRLERGVDGAGERLDGDGGLVGQILRDAVELGRVGDEGALGPATARVTAEAGLDAGAHVAPGDVEAEGVATRGAVRAGRVDAAGGAPEGRLDDHALPRAEARVVVGDDAHDLVTHHEGRARYRGEVRRVVRRERPEVRAADAGEERLHAHPRGRRELGFRGVFELQGGEAGGLQVLYPLGAGAHEEVAGDGLAVDEGEHLDLLGDAVLAPVPDLPPPLFGRRPEPAVRVHRDRVADGLEHRQVRDRVRVC